MTIPRWATHHGPRWNPRYGGLPCAPSMAVVDARMPRSPDSSAVARGEFSMKTIKAARDEHKRSAHWVPPKRDKAGQIEVPGYYRMSFRAWLRGWPDELKVKLTGKAARIVDGY